MDKENSNEQALLIFSTWMGILFTLLGVTWGLIIKSGVILFDGIYSGFSIILTMLSILALRMVNKSADTKFHFGRVAFEPLVLAFKSIVIICVCLYGFVTALIEIANGGSHITSSVAGIIYALVAISACLFSWLYLKRKGKGMPALIEAESEQWLVDTVFSSVVLFSFVASYIISLTTYSAFVPYIDPGMVILASCYFIRVPIMRFISSMQELLLMAPSTDIQDKLTTQIDKIKIKHNFEDAIVRSTKIGRELSVDINFLLPIDAEKYEIRTLDGIRAEVDESLASHGFKLYLNIMFTKDRRWTQ